MFSRNGKIYSAKTIVRKCILKQLPSNHIPYKISNAWVIEILPNVIGLEELLNRHKKIEQDNIKNQIIT